MNREELTKLFWNNWTTHLHLCREAGKIHHTGAGVAYHGINSRIRKYMSTGDDKELPQTKNFTKLLIEVYGVDPTGANDWFLDSSVCDQVGEKLK